MTAALYLGEIDSESGGHDVPRGRAEVRTAKSPDRESPNQDSAAVIVCKDDRVLLAVADGVGGSRAGREASNLLVRKLAQHVDSGEPFESARAPILDALEEANQSLQRDLTGAATTLALVELADGLARPYHVGDSELWVVGQRGRVKLQTVSHSPTGFAVEAGVMNEREAINHDERHIISNVVGAPDMRIEMGTAIELAPFDTLLLATDGLFDNLLSSEIIATIRKGPLSVAADKLFAKAQHRMNRESDRGPSKPDDLSLILYRQSRN